MDFIAVGNEGPFIGEGQSASVAEILQLIMGGHVVP